MDTVQTIVFEVCANDPFPESSCTPPSGFDASGAVLLSEAGEVGFALSPQSTANKIVIMRPPLAASQQQISYEFGGIKNPDTEGSYYVRLLTYQDGNLAGVPSYTGGIAFATGIMWMVTAAKGLTDNTATGLAANGRIEPADVVQFAGDFAAFLDAIFQP